MFAQAALTKQQEEDEAAIEPEAEVETAPVIVEPEAA
jgi:hypothetical protein